MQRMRFALKDILYCTAILALLLSWYIDRNALNTESSMLTSDLYEMKSKLRVLSTPGQSFVPQGMTAQFSTSGDVLDSNTNAGRREILSRLELGDLDFRILNSDNREQSGVEGAFNMKTLSAAEKPEGDAQ